MTTEPPVYEDWSGDTLRVFAQADDIRLAIGHPEDDYSACVDIPFADVRKVTAVMLEKAGLPDRWAELRKRVDADIDTYDEAARYCGTQDDAEGITEGRDKVSAAWFVLRYMDELEAGQ